MDTDWCSLMRYDDEDDEFYCKDPGSCNSPEGCPVEQHKIICGCNSVQRDVKRRRGGEL